MRQIGPNFSSGIRWCLNELTLFQRSIDEHNLKCQIWENMEILNFQFLLYFCNFVPWFADLFVMLSVLDSWTNYKLDVCSINTVPDSKVYGANMGPTRGQQDPGGPHDGPTNLAIWGCICLFPIPL